MHPDMQTDICTLIYIVRLYAVVLAYNQCNVAHAYRPIIIIGLLNLSMHKQTHEHRHTKLLEHADGDANPVAVIRELGGAPASTASI